MPGFMDACSTQTTYPPSGPAGSADQPYDPAGPASPGPAPAGVTPNHHSDSSGGCAPSSWRQGVGSAPRHWASLAAAALAGMAMARHWCRSPARLGVESPAGADGGARRTSAAERRPRSDPGSPLCGASGWALRLACTDGAGHAICPVCSQQVPTHAGPDPRLPLCIVADHVQ